MGTLRGKVTVITGGAYGIGNGIARMFAAQGASVALCDVRPDVVDRARSIAAATGARVNGIVADVRSAADVRRFVDDAAREYGGIDILVANAGVWRPTLSTTDSWEKALGDWEEVVNTNLRGVFYTGRAAIPHIIERGGGHIINIATDHITPPEGFATGGGTRMDVYDASKWGINGLTQAWSKLLKPHGIRVNALCMDATDSEMVRYASGGKPPADVVRRWMRPEQIGQLALDLIAEGSAGRTGENIGAWLGQEVKLPPQRTVLPSRHP